MAFTRIQGLLKAVTIQLENRLKSMYREAILPQEKSTSVILITVSIRFLWLPVWGANSGELS
ncbi:hypothetical protein AC527_18635 [Salmonella enterica]|uniref:Uncharacterized protein n=2 Tax=Salmonella enterica TaxID=28901 RepID=A0A5T2WJU3_SALER|nr:hypothetical protein [Salmonella enterica]